MVQFTCTGFAKSFGHLYEELIENVFLLNRWFKPKRRDAPEKSCWATESDDTADKKESYFGKSTVHEKETAKDFEELNRLRRLLDRDKLENDKILVKLPFWDKFKQRRDVGLRRPEHAGRSKACKIVKNLKKICAVSSKQQGDPRKLKQPLNRSILTFESSNPKLLRAKSNLEKSQGKQLSRGRLAKMSTSEIRRDPVKPVLPLNFVNGRNQQD